MQYLIPGGAYVDEDTALRDFLIPGGAYLTETTTAAATFQAGWAVTANQGVGFNLPAGFP